MKQMRLNFLFFINAILLFAQSPNTEKSKDSIKTISLEEVLLNGIRANEDSPVTFTNVTRKRFKSKKLRSRYSYFT
jgi:hypothetical protein